MTDAKSFPSRVWIDIDSHGYIRQAATFCSVGKVYLSVEERDHDVRLAKAEAYASGRARAFEEAASFMNEWGDAYSTDIWNEPTHVDTNSERTAAKMGRHICGKAAQDFMDMAKEAREGLK